MADEAKPAAEPRTVVGRCVTPIGSLLQRQTSGKTWQPLQPEDSIYTTDRLVALSTAALDTRSGAVRLSLWGDLADLSRDQFWESAVVLHDNPAVDLDFTLDRGRVIVSNRKEKGPARVRVRFRGEVWELHLGEPGTQIALELYGRWPRGVPFSKEPKPDEEPTGDLTLIVLKGEADVKAGPHQHALRAPPGPAFFHWDSASGPNAGPKRLEKLPAWTEPEAVTEPRLKQAQATLDRLRRRLVLTSAETALTEAVDAADSTYRRLAVFGLSAVDDLPALADALAHPRHADVRESAIVALRHWIGRGPGQDGSLYRSLVANRKYSPVHAEIVLQLLHSFDENDCAQPETYETLIAYLQHDRLPIRELAKWHLYRLVLAGKDIPYDAAGPAAERNQAYEKWKKLIPSGKLPAEPKSGAK